jgi:hypothetical protein
MIGIHDADSFWLAFVAAFFSGMVLWLVPARRMEDQ